MPTTHILKPAVSGLDEHGLNEHLCLAAASGLGIVSANSRVETFETERVIVIDRYDRGRRADGSMVRIHQVDMCQALGLDPSQKYQNEGGPAPERIVDLMRGHIQLTVARESDIMRFVAALAFNWIIAGTDAHAKNYSILLSGPTARLAPLYDVASALPYDDMHLPKLKMTMKIGGEYLIERISGRHWRRFATANQLDEGAVKERIGDLIAGAPAAFESAAENPAVQELKSELPGRLAELIKTRARSCAEALAR